MRIGKIVRIWEVEPVEEPQRAKPEPDRTPSPEPAEPARTEEPVESRATARPLRRR